MNSNILNTIFKNIYLQAIVNFKMPNFDNYIEQVIKKEQLINFTKSHWKNLSNFMTSLKFVLS